MLCKSCHYPLKQLTEPRCPECGREFDPDDSETYFVPREGTLSRWLLLLILGGLGYLAILAVCLYLPNFPYQSGTPSSSRFVSAAVVGFRIWLLWIIGMFLISITMSLLVIIGTLVFSIMLSVARRMAAMIGVPFRWPND